MINESRRAAAYIIVGISLIMLLNEFEIYTFNLGFDKILACAILIFILEAIIVTNFAIGRKRMKSSDIVGMALFPIPPMLYIAIFYFGLPFIPYIQLTVVLTMFIESIYALGM
jgi:hypothetical protein